MDDDLEKDDREDEEGEEWQTDEWEELTDEKKRELDPDKLKRELSASYLEGNEEEAINRASSLGYTLDDLHIA